MKTKKNIYSIFGYTKNNEEELAKILSENFEIELVRNDDFYEDEGPYVFFGEGKYIVDYLCIREQFRVGDNWENDFHKICPWAIQINFTRGTLEEKRNNAKKVRKFMNKHPDMRELEFEEFDWVIEQ